MPTYEYACKACGEHVEVVQSFKDEPLTECPACGGPLRKVFGAVGIVLKGSGFYRNDSRTASKPGAGKSGADAGEKKSDAKTEGSGAKSEGSGAKPSSGESSSKPDSSSKAASSSSA